MLSNLRVAIQLRNVTQEKLAAELGISRFYMSRIVAGQRRGYKYRARLAELLNSDPRWLFAENQRTSIPRKVRLGPRNVAAHRDQWAPKV